MNNAESKKIAEILGCVCIQLRDMVTFMVQTLQTLYQCRSQDDTEYHNEFLSEKVEYMTLDVVLQHARTYQYFQDYIQKHAKDDRVYLNLYLMIKIYQNDVNKLGSIDQML